MPNRSWAPWGATSRMLCGDRSPEKGYMFRCGNVHIRAADGSVAVVDRVDCVDRFENILYGAHCRVLTRLQSQALVSHILQGDNLLTNLLLRELAAGNGTVDGVVRAIYAAIYAVV